MYPTQISDVRGKGLMIGVEFSDKVAKGTAGAITKACLENGLLLLSAGAYLLHLYI